MGRMKLGTQNEERTDFATSDLYLASAVSLLLKIFPEYELAQGKILFHFPKSPELYEAIASYSDGILLNAYEYAFRIKRLRAEMLLRKNELSDRSRWETRNG